VDVRFRDANFQIKEIVTSGTMRSLEVKSDYERVKYAIEPKDIVGPQLSYDVPAPAAVYSLVESDAVKLSLQPKYALVKSQIDLLFYVTRINASPVMPAEIQESTLRGLGWRSISCLAGPQAIVLFAAEGAPDFLAARSRGTAGRGC
jgi:hypothetical protein